jgi:hypothetical protein
MSDVYCDVMEMNRELSQHDRLVLAEKIDVISVRQGTTIYKQNDASLNFFIIVRGSVEVRCLPTPQLQSFALFLHTAKILFRN